jgi:hypothetical protein
VEARWSEDARCKSVRATSETNTHAPERLHTGRSESVAESLQNNNGAAAMSHVSTFWTTAWKLFKINAEFSAEPVPCNGECFVDSGFG